jgi:hypothetical protein
MGNEFEIPSEWDADDVREYNACIAELQGVYNRCIAELQGAYDRCIAELQGAYDPCAVDLMRSQLSSRPRADGVKRDVPCIPPGTTIH